MIAPSPLIPRKLRRGDTIRVVAPALSRAFVAEHDHSPLATFPIGGRANLTVGATSSLRLSDA